MGYRKVRIKVTSLVHEVQRKGPARQSRNQNRKLPRKNTKLIKILTAEYAEYAEENTIRTGLLRLNKKSSRKWVTLAYSTAENAEAQRLVRFSSPRRGGLEA